MCTHTIFCNSYTLRKLLGKIHVDNSRWAERLTLKLDQLVVSFQAVKIVIIILLCQHNFSALFANLYVLVISEGFAVGAHADSSSQLGLKYKTAPYTTYSLVIRNRSGAPANKLRENVHNLLIRMGHVAYSSSKDILAQFRMGGKAFISVYAH